MKFHLPDQIERMMRRFWESRVRRGTVTGTTGARVFVQWADQDDPEPKSFARLASYASPSQGDEVIAIRISGGRRSDWIVIGEIERA